MSERLQTVMGAGPTGRILCLDFDGVLHSYKSGWKGATVIPDPPVVGMAKFLESVVDKFYVTVFSNRSLLPGGIQAMRQWMQDALIKDMPDEWWKVFNRLHWPTEKPAAFLTLDDRAVTFTGEWPEVEELEKFKSWTGD